MKDTRRFLSTFVITALLALSLITPVSAFDGRGGNKVVIEAGEIINDDLYVGAEAFVLDGTVNGDVIVFGQTITINGKVDGDLMAAGETVIVNGEVTGASRIAGSALFVGEKAIIGGDIVGAGYSIEARAGSTIGQDVVFTGGQILLAGDVARNVQVATGAFELSGAVGGNVSAQVGEAEAGAFPPGMFMQRSAIAIPEVKPGLAIEPSATIAGDLAYTQSQELTFPAGVVTGKITQLSPSSGTAGARQEASGQKLERWVLEFVRTSITLILMGLFLLWLFPAFVRSWSDHLQASPLPSLGWGAVAWIGFFVAGFLVVCVTIIGGFLFSILTLSQLSGTVIGFGVLVLLTLVVGFVLVTSFVAKVVFGAALGRWVLIRATSSLAEHQYWPMVVGVLITVVVIDLLSIPPIPGILARLLNFAIVLFGLGALWIWGRERRQRQAA